MCCCWWLLCFIVVMIRRCVLRRLMLNGLIIYVIYWWCGIIFGFRLLSSGLVCCGFILIWWCWCWCWGYVVNGSVICMILIFWCCGLVGIWYCWLLCCELMILLMRLIWNWCCIVYYVVCLIFSVVLVMC